METNGSVKRYSPEVRARAVRMVLEHRTSYGSEWQTICSIAPKFGCTAETLRNWVRQNERDRGLRYRPDGTPLPMIALPVFSYKSHISIDRRYGFIRGQAVTSVSSPDGRMLKHVVGTDNTSGEVWADSAYRSQSNEKWLAGKMLVSRIHRRKPAGKPMPKATARANARKSSVRARVEHVFAHQKNRFGLFIRTIGIKRAEAKLTLANRAYNMGRHVVEKSLQRGSHPHRLPRLQHRSSQRPVNTAPQAGRSDTGDG